MTLGVKRLTTGERDLAKVRIGGWKESYRGADTSLARPGRKQSGKHVRDERDNNNMDTRAVIKFLFLQGKTPKEIHAILTETLTCFLPSRAKDLSAPPVKRAGVKNINLCISRNPKRPIDLQTVTVLTSTGPCKVSTRSNYRRICRHRLTKLFA